MDVRERLKQFDFNRDGKVSIADAEAVLDEKLAGKSPALIFGIGVAVGAVIMFFVRPLLG